MTLLRIRSVRDRHRPHGAMHRWRQEDSMQIEDHIIEALLLELERQASNPKQQLTVQRESAPNVRINGRVDLEQLAMVVMGKLAGGP